MLQKPKSVYLQEADNIFVSLRDIINQEFEYKLLDFENQEPIDYEEYQRTCTIWRSEQMQIIEDLYIYLISEIKEI